MLKYDYISPFINGLTKVELRGKCGLIDKAGKEVIPIIYDSIEKFNNLELIKVKLNGKWGLINKTLKEISPCIYNNIYRFSNGLAKVKIKSKFGLINGTGKEVASCIYDDIEKFDYAELVKLKLGNKYGFFDKINEKVVPCIYDDIERFNYSDLFKIRLDNKYGLVDKTNEQVTPCIYDNIERFNYLDLAKVRLDNKYGFVNKIGKEVIPCVYDDIGEFDYFGLAKVKLDNKYGFVNKTGKKIIPCVYDDVGKFDYFGLTKVKLNNKWGFINPKNIIVIPIKYDEINSLGNELLKVKLDNKYGFIDKNGKEIIPCIYDDIGAFAHLGLAKIRLDNKYGFIDKTGEKVVPCMYDSISYISEGLISAKLNDKWGYIDSRNNIAVPFVYEDVSDFKNNLARVKFNGKYGLIDRKGKEITAIFTPSEVSALKMKNDLFPKFDNSLNTTEITIDGIEKNGVKIVKYKEPLFVPFKSYYIGYFEMNNAQKRFYFYWCNQVKEGNYIKTDLSYILIYACELVNNIGWDNPDDGYYLLLNVWLKYKTDFPELNWYLFHWIIDFIFINRPTIKIDDFIEHISKNGINIFNNNYYSEQAKFIMNSYFTIKKDNISTLPAIEAISTYKIAESKIYNETTKEIIDNTIQDIIKLVNNYFLKKTGKDLLEFLKPALTKFKIRPYTKATISFINDVYTIEYYSYINHEPLKIFFTNIIRYTENMLRKELKYSGKLKVSLEKEYSDLIDEYFARKNEKKKKIVSPIEIDFSKVKKLEEESLEVTSMLTADIDYHNEIDILKNKIFENETKEEVKENEIINNQKNMRNECEWLNNFNDVHKEIIQAIIEKKEINYITDIANRHSSMPEILIDEINGIASDNIGDFLIETGSSTLTIINEYEEMVKNFLSEGN